MITVTVWAVWLIIALLLVGVIMGGVALFRWQRGRQLATPLPPETEDQRLTRETREMGRLTRELEAAANPLSSPEGYREAVEAIRSRRLRLDHFAASLDLEEARRVADQRLREREDALRARSSRLRQPEPPSPEGETPSGEGAPGTQGS